MKKGVSKKGQVSVFVIIAIVIVVVIVGVFAFRSGLIGGGVFEDVETTVLYCVTDIGQEAIETIGIQGGYYKNLPGSYVDLEWAIIPYYYYEGDLLMPETSVIETELEAYVDDNLGDCIDNYVFGDFQVSYGDIKTNAEIKQGVVTFTVDSIVSMSKEGETSEFNLADNPVDNPTALEDMLEVARFITDAHKEEEVCITCLYDMLEDRNLYLDIIDFTASSSWIVISEDGVSEEPYAFEFINKYEGEDEVVELTEE